MKRSVLALVLVAALATGCNQSSPDAPGAKLAIPELTLPAGYRGWSKFLSDVQRPDAKQVREIYVNPIGSRAIHGQPFPEGTVLVMENYAARADAEGRLLKGSDGMLVKGDLLRVFVMGKGPGFGEAAPPGLRNGEWLYAAYDADGTRATDDLNACRACHLPVAAQDYVQRYEQYFALRKAE